MKTVGTNYNSIKPKLRPRLLESFESPRKTPGYVSVSYTDKQRGP